MVQTKKFSEFDDANLTNSGNKIAGYASSLNVKSSKVVSWTTATRPAPPFNGLLGYNTDLNEYEYYDDSVPGWVQLIESSSGMNWTTITLPTTASVNSGYIANSGGVLAVTLPAIAAIGDRVVLLGRGTGGWSLVANAGQIINFGNLSSSTAGSISSTHKYDNVEVVCMIADTEWQVKTVIGNLTVA